MARALRARTMRLLARYGGLRLFVLLSRSLATQPEQAPDGISLRVLAYEEVLRFGEDATLDLRHEAVYAAHARGDVCVGAFERGALAGYCWLAFAPLHHLDGVSVQFGADVVWTYKSLVRNAYRGRGIAPALYRHADALCLERGRARSLICVESHNGASIAAALRAGYARAGRAAYIRRGRFFADWYSEGLISRYGLSFFVPE
jgi:GNAT superfamily N-acetyltransferase